MKGPIQIRFGLSFLPTLQYSSIPKELAPVLVKQLNSDLVPRTRFSMLNHMTSLFDIAKFFVIN